MHGTRIVHYMLGGINGYVAAVVGIDSAYVLYTLCAQIHYICMSFL